MAAKRRADCAPPLIADVSSHPETVAEDSFADDPSHPIPSLGRIDTLVTTTDKCRYYGLVIASPLGQDHRSKQRLLRKLRDYMNDRHSDDVLREFGPATPANTKLTVLVHPGSDPAIFALLEQSRSALEESGFTFEVTTDAKMLGLH